MISWADTSLGAFGVPRRSRYAGLATRTWLTDPTRDGFMLLSAKSPMRTATSTDSLRQMHVAIRQRQMNAQTWVPCQKPGDDRQHMEPAKQGGRGDFERASRLGVLAADRALCPLDASKI